MVNNQEGEVVQEEWIDYMHQDEITSKGNLQIMKPALLGLELCVIVDLCMSRAMRLDDKQKTEKESNAV